MCLIKNAVMVFVDPGCLLADVHISCITGNLFITNPSPVMLWSAFFIGINEILVFYLEVFLELDQAFANPSCVGLREF